LENIKEFRELFYKKNGYRLNLKNPRSFSEKVVYKKLHDRNPLIVETSDKLKARDYIRQRVGPEAEKHLVPLLWVGKNPEDIPFNALPKNCVIKPNNASGRYIIVKSGIAIINRYNNVIENITLGRVIDICRKWFDDIFGEKYFSWAYSQIEPQIVIEKLLLTDEGKLPSDYRFYMFSGECKLIMVTTGRLVKPNYTHYDTNWNKLNVKRKGYGVDNISKPESLGQMILFAKILSEPFDMARIDFYYTDRVWFGEITHYPGGGMSGYVPKSFDFEVGKYWHS